MRTFTLAAAAALTASAAVALYAAVPAVAQPDGPEAPGADTTLAEAQARGAAMFARLDVNKDGVLSETDRDARTGQIFDEIDANHDGSISRGEFIAHHRAMMARDGGPGRDGPRGPGGWREGMRDPMRGPGGEHMGGMMAGRMAEMADTNHDGQITRAEFDAATKARFDRMDANHDGKITRAERRAAFAAMHGREDGRDGGPRPPMGADIGDMPPPPPPGD